MTVFLVWDCDNPLMPEHLCAIYASADSAQQDAKLRNKYHTEQSRAALARVQATTVRP